MNEHAPALPEPDAAARAALDAAQEALAILIRLHDREADAALITGLKGIQAGTLFAALLGSRTGKQAAGLLQSALDALPEAADPHVLDRLAVDYAEIYLTNGFRIAPEASVWLTDEGLERQEPMFEVRDWYTHYG
ncbi:MAG: molecular chaperone TorD family protein, partial [Rhodobacteraceae bacterium]|nr:molecular chaperone TorD family protein [Paracoccaceae bacterium]